MDLTESIAPKSDQLNAEDMLTGPRTFTIERVAAGSAEQPVDIFLVEFPGRPYRPSKSMRRVMVNAWGKEASTYAGHRLTLYRDPEITFGPQKVGGIKISHLSHIDKRTTVALTVKRGQRAQFTVEPLPDAPTTPTAPTAGQIAASTDPAELRGWWKASTPAMRKLIEARVTALTAPVEPEPAVDEYDPAAEHASLFPEDEES